MPPQQPVLRRTDIWREGKWLDLWSVVHFLSGVSLGLAGAYLHFGAAASIVIAFLLLVGYELWEALVKIEETPQNRFMDVVVGMTSFVPVFFLSMSFAPRQLIPAFCMVLLVNVTMATLGWLESRKAAAFEERMRERYLEERTRFLERRARRLALRRGRREQRGSLSDNATF